MVSKRVFVVAGEPSGDLLGSGLIKQLKELDLNLEIEGIGGPSMLKNGLKESLFPMKDLSIMGILEVAPRIPKLLYRMRQTVRYIKKYNPDVVLTIDSPGFNFILAKRLRQLSSFKGKLVQYVSPSIWAYKPKRAEKIANLFDHILLLLPFESPYYEDLNFSHTYVGHPIVEEKLKTSEELESVRERLGIKAADKLVMVMPGSRESEIKRHLPTLEPTLFSLHKEGVKIAISTLPHLLPVVRKNLKALSSSNILLNADPEYKKALMQLADFGLIKSGTITLEAARFGLPHLVFYKTNSLTAHLMKKVLLNFTFALPNLIAGTPVVPELIQDEFTSDNVSRLTSRLLSDNAALDFQKSKFKELITKLYPEGKEDPSLKAAQVIAGYLNA